MEALDVRILHRLTGVSEVQVHPMGVCPGGQGPPSEFGAVIHRDQLGQTTLTAPAVQDLRHPEAGQRGIHLRRKTRSGEITHDGQHSDPPGMKDSKLKRMYHSPTRGGVPDRQEDV